MPETFSNWRKAFRFAQETVQIMSIVTHREMRQQLGLLAGRREIVKSAHRHIKLVADAIDVNHDLRRVLFGEDTGQSSDHVRVISF
jgi:hypothetical protein